MKFSKRIPKILVVFLIIVLASCDTQNKDLSQVGVVINQTSCTGGPEPVFVIKLSKKDSIMTATLPKEFQKSNLKIQFKTKEKSSDLICTLDKIYPNQFDVYDVVSL